MERREHGLAYAFETLTTVVRMGITTKTRFVGIVGSSASTIFGSTRHMWFVLHSVGLLLVFGGRY